MRDLPMLRNKLLHEGRTASNNIGGVDVVLTVLNAIEWLFCLAKGFPFIALWPVVALGGPMIWAFALSPWSGALGWLGMSLAVLATIAPIIVKFEYR
jgi:hypothetical protein